MAPISPEAQHVSPQIELEPSPPHPPRPRQLPAGRRRSAGMPTVPPLPDPPLPPPQPFQPSDDDREGGGDLRAIDCNLASLCEHIQAEGFNSGAFSDVAVQAMGSTYRLHRLILSRSSYFRNMLHGPWKEAGAPTVVLHIDDANVNSEAISIALAYLYGHQPKLNDSNAFRVLAAASFLDLQHLCAICTDFIISELWISNFLQYQVFAESQDYGIHGERVRNACWGYLCQSATMELREVLPKLSSQTLHALLTTDELWVPNEEKRFELALCTLLAKCAISEAAHAGEENLGHKSAQNTRDELPDYVVDFEASVAHSKPVQVQETTCSKPVQDSQYVLKMEKPITLTSLADTNSVRASCSYAEPQIGVETIRARDNDTATEGPAGESTCYHLNSNTWIPGDQSRDCSSTSRFINEGMPNDWGRCSMPTWGGRIVGRRQIKSSTGNPCVNGDEYDAFVNIFEGGSLLYSNMSFEALLNVRKQLEELGFPCKAVNDGLWLQMLLCHRVQAVGADTCRNCCLTSNICACRQAYGYSHGGSPRGYYRQEHDRNVTSGNIGNIYLAEAQGDGSGLFGPVRVHVRGAIDGLAGIGRGTTYVSGTAWPPTRYVFSRVPFGTGNRNCQQSVANDESEPRVDLNGEISGDGLTALVGLSHGNNSVHVNNEQTARVYEPDLQSRYGGAASVSSASAGISVQMLEPQEHALGLDWESSEGSSISLDMKTPLRHFPPFRFGVEFEDVHRLTDGQVKHSPEVFYAGSLWKVSVQAFNDEDPQGRRTLGLFLHRRKAEMTDSLRKVQMYIDSREKVTARYQLICPSKREVMVFGSFKQAGTLLPKAPKGWGWRTALLFDELADLLQGGALRVTAVVQLV